MRAIMIAAALLTGAAPIVAATAVSAQTSQVATSNNSPRFERDRQSILAQAGQFRVHFDMRENVSFQADYDPLEEQLSSGTEIVRVVYDKSDRISLQHILVMEHDGQSIVVKHWRQAWIYQPQNVLTYVGDNTWRTTPVPADQRQGAWSQTVWQTDDSPRYGGVGRWTYENGLSAWTSGPTWRPLARRDAVRNPVYDRYLGTNRHILKPDGWVHIQDNMKLSGRDGGEPVAIVQEDVINTYETSIAFSPKAGDDYWAATQSYWGAVRDMWDAVIARDGGVHIAEEAETGAITAPPLMKLAQQVQAGVLTTDAALLQARALIEATAQ